MERGSATFFLIKLYVTPHSRGRYGLGESFWATIFWGVYPGRKLQWPLAPPGRNRSKSNFLFTLLNQATRGSSLCNFLFSSIIYVRILFLTPPRPPHIILPTHLLVKHRSKSMINNIKTYFWHHPDNSHLIPSTHFFGQNRSKTHQNRTFFFHLTKSGYQVV